MSEQKAQYSPEFQHFRQLVKTALVQSATDAREIAERTGTQLVIRERLKPDGNDQTGHKPGNTTASGRLRSRKSEV